MANAVEYFGKFDRIDPQLQTEASGSRVGGRQVALGETRAPTTRCLQQKC